MRVKIIIDEDGTANPPELPPGTVIRSLVGTDHGTYLMVRLDHPVRCRRAPENRDWVLRTLVISNRYKGKSLNDLITPPVRKDVTVGISNLLTEIPPDEIMLDFAKVDYFALGRVSKLSEQI